MEVSPIGFVRGGREEVKDDNWGDVVSTLEIDSTQFDADCLSGLDGFSHLVVVYQFHLVDLPSIQTGARHPRNNNDWPKVGIFAQRGKNRPNRIGVSTCQILSVDGLTVTVQGLDAVDGTPILDIKPYMTGFDPRGAIREPDWATELMAGYWELPG